MPIRDVSGSCVYLDSARKLRANTYTLHLPDQSERNTSPVVAGRNSNGSHIRRVLLVAMGVKEEVRQVRITATVEKRSRTVAGSNIECFQVPIFVFN